jgi:hypothetical protein
VTPRRFPSTPEAAGLLRIWVFGLWLVDVACDPLGDLAHLPRELFTPPGMLMLLPEAVWDVVLSSAGLACLKGALLASLVAATAGWIFRPAALLASLLLVVTQGVIRGFGHINHAEIPMLYAAFLLALFPCADAWALRRRPAIPARSEFYAAPFLLIIAALSFSYYFAGLNRVFHGREVFFGQSMQTWLISGALRDAGASPGLGRLANNMPLFQVTMDAGFYLVSLLELLAPLCLVSRRFRWIFCPVMGLFHLLAWVGMNLLFWAHLALLPTFFDIDAIVAWLRGRLDRAARSGAEVTG